MHCSNCGNKIDENIKFCPHCGNKFEQKEKKEVIEKTKLDVDALFYSEDWTRTNFFAISSIPNYDILITEKDFYIIQFPASSSSTLGCVLGLIFFNLLGAIIGSMIGSSSDNKKRKKYRSAWVDSDRVLVSRKYEDNIFLLSFAH